MLLTQIERFMDDYTYGKTYLDPEHVKDGGVTHEHVRERAFPGGSGHAYQIVLLLWPCTHCVLQQGLRYL